MMLEPRRLAYRSTARSDGLGDATNSLLDDAVQEVFGLMLGMACAVDLAKSDCGRSAGRAAESGTASRDAASELAAERIAAAGKGRAGKDAGCEGVSHTGADAQMMAVVGFAGVMSGACVARTSEAAARRMTGSMLGTETEQMDQTVADALGEVCNMVAGGWKGRVPALASGCLLSVPAVIIGGSCYLQAAAQRIWLDRGYLFDGHRIRFTLLCESIG